MEPVSIFRAVGIRRASCERQASNFVAGYVQELLLLRRIEQGKGQIMSENERISRGTITREYGCSSPWPIRIAGLGTIGGFLAVWVAFVLGYIPTVSTAICASFVPGFVVIPMVALGCSGYKELE